MSTIGGVAKFTTRNFEQEAKFQIKLLEQKARENFLDNFSQNEDITMKIVPTVKLTQREATKTKTYISSASKMILEKWMYEHRLYCYPTKAEKNALAKETGLSLQTISNWFINSRRRMLPKILETEGKNSINFTISRKKKKNGAGGLKSVSASTNCAEPNETLAHSNITNDNEIEVQTQENTICFEPIIQEFMVPYTDDENLKLSTSHHCRVQGKNQVIRGILYDHATQSKCLFIIVDSPK